MAAPFTVSFNGLCPFLRVSLYSLLIMVDLCHVSNDDDEDEGCSYQEALLEKLNTSDSNVNDRCRCCSFRSIPIGSRQKIVILVTVIVFAIMIACSVLIWVGMRKGPINPAIVAEARLMLFLKMRKVRSDRASSEMRKVAGLAIVSVLSFASSASVAIGTNIPLFYHWHEREISGVYTSLLLVVYYFLGSSVPSAFILFVMRELPPPLVIKRQEQSRTTLAFISDRSAATHGQRWTAATSVQNQVSRASPI
ncbi:UNVERIFIED_CONTAM: hypothetical protein Scaly_1310300 [Sesamum calycinum]|uniref:THH1/TOM1/TOM3 domain-containing protein n=1 Tax=Sesamum calycinum TaxID=2727403 RepID=A0AAW2Q701_9LAMI